jgi:hypothetical protein
MKTILVFLFIIVGSCVHSQIVINEGCNKNYLSTSDENGDASDWIELHNAGTSPVNLNGYALSDKPTVPNMWILPNLSIPAGGFQQIFCSQKNRFGSAPFQFGLSQQNFTPQTGWNQHQLVTPFYWDGVSNVVINVCSYNNAQYTENSIFKQTATSYVSTIASFIDGSPAACSANNASTYSQRPNIKLNNAIIGTGTIQNGNTDYPAPYGNWYWGTRHQILIRASELSASGLSAGMINSIGFEVAATNGENYTYVDFHFNTTSLTELTNEFIPVQGNLIHTNFKLEGNGESVYLFDPAQQLVSSLIVESPEADISVGLSPDASTIVKWLVPSPAASNNSSVFYSDSLKRPILSKTTGINNTSFYLKISHNNVGPSKLVYTTNGSEPSFNSPTYTDSIFVYQKTVIRAKVFPLDPNGGFLPSQQSIGTYIFNVSHGTPILLVTTDQSNLYGSTGIFDNWSSDWIKPAHAVYLNEGVGHPLVFERFTSIRMDGGAGGSRSQPQHSFRLSFDHGALGQAPVNYPLIPDRPDRTKYSEIYLRNGSNQYLSLPYKDASQVRMMSEGTKNYYSAYRPVSVYINGSYFGLYELREKFNSEFFEIHDGANKDSLELLSLSYWYNLVLRAVEGDAQHFWDSYADFLTLNPLLSSYVNDADQLIDMKHYSDYIIAESWMGNVDWPGNNIKVYRSDKTNWRWRFGLIDLELSMQPNGWTSCTDNHINYMLGQSTENPYINIWLKSIQNTQYKNYFINRFADLMNTSYQTDVLLAREQTFFESMVTEMPNEFARWGDPNNIAGQMEGFVNNHEVFQDQLACRNEVVFDNIKTGFNLVKTIEVNLEVYPENGGEIALNTIQPVTYPWTGRYFDGVPIQLVPVAKPGYEFSHWLPGAFISDTLQDSLSTNISANIAFFTAVFKLIPLPPDGPDIHFTVAPNPSNGTFVLSHDNKTQASGCTYEIFDLSGRIIAKGTVNNTALETPISIPEMRSAIYILRVQKNVEVLSTFKVLKY